MFFPAIKTPRAKRVTLRARCARMNVFGIVGRKNSGKTHLVARLVAAATRRGLVVSTVKHAHHGFDVDQPGKDSYVHREAGAREVVVSSALRWALLHVNRGAPEPSLDELLARLSPCDLVLVEGFKAGRHSKLEVYRPACGQPPRIGDFHVTGPYAPHHVGQDRGLLRRDSAAFAGDTQDVRKIDYPL